MGLQFAVIAGGFIGRRVSHRMRKRYDPMTCKYDSVEILFYNKEAKTAHNQPHDETTRRWQIHAFDLWLRSFARFDGLRTGSAHPGAELGRHC